MAPRNFQLKQNNEFIAATSDQQANPSPTANGTVQERAVPTTKGRSHAKTKLGIQIQKEVQQCPATYLPELSVSLPQEVDGRLSIVRNHVRKVLNKPAPTNSTSPLTPASTNKLFYGYTPYPNHFGIVALTMEDTLAIMQKPLYYNGRPYNWSTAKGDVQFVTFRKLPLNITAGRIHAATKHLGNLSNLQKFESSDSEACFGGYWTAMLHPKPDCPSFPLPIKFNGNEKEYWVLPVSSCLMCYDCGCINPRSSSCNCAQIEPSVHHSATPGEISHDTSMTQEAVTTKHAPSSIQNANRAPSTHPSIIDISSPTVLGSSKGKEASRTKASSSSPTAKILARATPTKPSPLRTSHFPPPATSSKGQISPAPAIKSTSISNTTIKNTAQSNIVENTTTNTTKQTLQEVSPDEPNKAHPTTQDMPLTSRQTSQVSMAQDPDNSDTEKDNTENLQTVRRSVRSTKPVTLFGAPSTKPPGTIARRK
ncbi:hypothetical protein H4219_006452 [Mycoemilia scoparia]|uniref:Uncharacterized protein n=1 Tax=Mycoemilia scoparia TaxID=417184 RepID=A0A9W7ZJH9_9FUNG|nr:hypothetical protein H4219_006452 [Mycoemilia scoparia]